MLLTHLIKCLAAFALIMAIYAVSSLGVEQIRSDPTTLFYYNGSNTASRCFDSAIGSVCHLPISALAEKTKELDQLQIDVMRLRRSVRDLAAENKRSKEDLELTKADLKERQVFIRDLEPHVATLRKLKKKSADLEECRIRLQDVLDNGRPDPSYRPTEESGKKKEQQELDDIIIGIDLLRSVLDSHRESLL